MPLFAGGVKTSGLLDALASSTLFEEGEDGDGGAGSDGDGSPGGRAARASAAIQAAVGDKDGTAAKKVKGLGLSQSAPSLDMEQEEELRQFLKIVRPDWSCPKKRGQRAPVCKVLDKLRAIGVTDAWELMQKVTRNTINEELDAAHRRRFSRDTIDSIRAHSSFFRALEHLNEPQFRQTGHFAPVPQMLTKTSLRTKAVAAGREHGFSFSSQASPAARARPASEGGFDRPRTMSTLTGDSSGMSSALPGGAMAGGRLATADVSGASWFTVRTASPRAHTDAGSADAFGDSQQSFFSARNDLDDTSTTCSSLRFGKPRSRKGKRNQPSQFLSQSLGASGSLPELSQTTPPATPSQAQAAAHRARTSLNGGTSSGLDPRPGSSQGRSRSCSPARVVGPGASGSPAVAATEEVLRVAKWSDPSADALLRQGEKMLKEQESLDERRLFDKIIEAQGTNTMRKHVAANIRSRMVEERNRDPEYNLDRQQTDQRGITIKKELNLMANARRDLTVFRKEVQTKLEDEAANVGAAELAGPGGQKFRKSLAHSAPQEHEQVSSFVSAAATRASVSGGAPKGHKYAPRFPDQPKSMPSTCTAD